MQKNIIYVPPYYFGTSFEEIFLSLKHLIEKYNLPIALVGDSTPLPNLLRDGQLDSPDSVLLQTKNLLGLLKGEEVSRLLFLDFFQPGLDLVKYFYFLKGKSLKTGALLHGGSFLAGDLYNWNWLPKLEEAYAAMFDVIYAPSRHLYKTLPPFIKSKAAVFPWGLDYFLANKPDGRVVKDQIVLFPHRFDMDKGVEELITIAKKAPKLKFLVTCPSPKAYRKAVWRTSLPNLDFIFEENHLEHLQTLSRAKIVLSTARQENFGYSMLKAALCGAIPVVPDRLVYREYFPAAFRYSDSDDAAEKLESLMSSTAWPGQDLKNIIKTFSTFSFLPLLEVFFNHTVRPNPRSESDNG